MTEFVKKFKDAGATILGGCCETSPAHIKEMSKLVWLSLIFKNINEKYYSCCSDI